MVPFIPLLYLLPFCSSSFTSELYTRTTNMTTTTWEQSVHTRYPCSSLLLCATACISATDSCNSFSYMPNSDSCQLAQVQLLLLLLILFQLLLLLIFLPLRSPSPRSQQQGSRASKLWSLRKPWIACLGIVMEATTAVWGAGGPPLVPTLCLACVPQVHRRYGGLQRRRWLRGRPGLWPEDLCWGL